MKNMLKQALFTSLVLLTTLSYADAPVQNPQYAALTTPTSHVTEAEYTTFVLHWIDSLANPGGNMLRFEDGSEWNFDKDDMSVIRTWRPGDMIIITPRQPLPWGSAYTYVITNRDLNSSIYANLIIGPIRYGTMSHWAYGLNRDTRTVYLVNGQGERTCWEIDPYDIESFKEWEHYDTLIIGYNNSWPWLFSSYDHILINVPSNHFVRAKLISSCNFPTN